MAPFDIYNAEQLWNGCLDMRPWPVVQVRPNNVLGCFPISSAAYSGSCFQIRDDDPDFPATGLSKSCYIHDDHLIDIPASRFKRYRGTLTGNLLARFRQYAGV